MSSAPLLSLAALAICGTYAKTRRLLHSVNAVSVMSAIVIPRGILLGRGLLFGFRSPGIARDKLPRSYRASDSFHPLRATTGMRCLPRAVGWLDEHTPARSGAAHLDHHRLPHFDEMGEVCGLGVEASRGQRFQRRRIERFAVARVPSAGQDRHLARVRMRVWREVVSGGETQAPRLG